MNYWKEHAEIALNDAGLPKATEEQLEIIAGVIESAHEFYGQNMGHDVATSNFHAEKDRNHKDAIARIEAERDRERDAEHERFKRAREEHQAVAWRLSDARREIEQLKAQ